MSHDREHSSVGSGLTEPPCFEPADERQTRIIARELSHRVKNIFAVIGGIVSVTGRTRGIPEEAAEINGRIQALARVYETTLDEAASGMIEIGPAIRAILAPYDDGDARLRFLGNGCKVHFSTVSVVGLVLHELAANAARFGAWARDGGRVELDWRAADGERTGDVAVRWRESGGPMGSPAPAENSTGTQIVDRMLRLGGGRIDRRWNSDGFEAKIVIPA